MPETVAVSWLGGMAYVNDGKGTPEPISAKSLTMNLDIPGGESNSAQSEQKRGGVDGIIMVFIVALGVVLIYGYKKFLTK
jgi:hypothetical protein